MCGAAWVRLVRLAFWLLYNPLAWTYDRVSRIVSLGHWHDWQRASLRVLRGKRVLELAFGTGDMLFALDAADYRPVGLELSSTMTHIAQRKLRRHGLVVPLVRGCAQQLPFADASFDAVLCTFPAEFIVAQESLGEVARVLQRGGRAVIVLMARFTEDRFGSRVLEWLYRITGQRGPVPDLGPLLAAQGLRYETAWVPVDSSAVLLAVIAKPIDG